MTIAHNTENLIRYYAPTAKIGDDGAIVLMHGDIALAHLPEYRSAWQVYAHTPSHVDDTPAGILPNGETVSLEAGLAFAERMTDISVAFYGCADLQWLCDGKQYTLPLSWFDMDIERVPTARRQTTPDIADDIRCILWANNPTPERDRGLRHHNSMRLDADCIHLAPMVNHALNEMARLGLWAKAVAMYQRDTSPAPMAIVYAKDAI